MRRRENEYLRRTVPSANDGSALSPDSLGYPGWVILYQLNFLIWPMGHGSPSCLPRREYNMNLRGGHRCEKEWESIKCMGLVWENKTSDSAWQARLLRQWAGRTQKTTTACVSRKERPLLSGINYPWGRGVRAVCSLSGLLGHLTLWDINSQGSLVIFNLHQCLFFQFCPPLFLP